MSDNKVMRQKFIQSFMSKGILDAKEVKDLMSDCGVNVESKEEMVAYVRNVNTVIAPFHLEIKKGIQEEDGTSFYCLINTVETAISRLSSTYSPNELEFFKKLVEQIVITEDGMIGSLAALRLTERLEKRMGKEEAQNFLDRLEKDKWIKKDAEGKLCLSVRSMVELEQYLKDMYSEFIKTCTICSKMCLLGEICRNCGIKLHRKCAKTLFTQQGNDKKCPARDCRAPWGQIMLN